MQFFFLPLSHCSCFFLDIFSSGVWASFAGLRDPSLRELASRLESTVIASRAAGATDAYRRAFLRWRSFASSKDEIQVFPARTEHVALYLQHVLDTTQSPSAVDSAIYGRILPFMAEFLGFLHLLTVLFSILLVELPRS